MNPFSSFPKEDARVEKNDGSVVGPYKATFAGNTIVVWDAQADIEEGDVILRNLPSGKDEKIKHRGRVFILDNLVSRPARRTAGRSTHFTN